MDDAIDVPHGGFHRGEIGEIGGRDLFAGARRPERRDVGEAQARVAAAQAFAQGAADFPGRAGDENAIHQDLFSNTDAIDRPIITKGDVDLVCRSPHPAPRLRIFATSATPG